MRNWRACGRLCLIVAMGCAALGGGGCSSDLRIQSDSVPAGSHRLAQVVTIGTRQETMELKELRDTMIACGVKEQEIADGSIVVARVECCGGANERETATMLYVPPAIHLERGDVVEFTVGSPAKGKDPGQLNTVTRVRQKNADATKEVRWDPPNQQLWGRVLYAEWMPGEGWVKEGGLIRRWYKPAAEK